MNDLMALEERNPTAILESVERMLREATDELDGNWSLVGGGNAPATHSGGISLAMRGMTNLQGRDNGRYWPFYENERQLQSQRAICRNLSTFTAIAVGAMQALQVYVMGGEWEYEVAAKYGEEVADDFIKEVQCVVDEILEKNGFIGSLDNEFHDASREDGDSLVALYAAPDGICDIRRIDADNLRKPHSREKLDSWLGTDWNSPSGNPAFSWEFGVMAGYDERMKRIDYARPLGYHVVFDEAGREYDFLPAWPMAGSDLDDRCGHLIKSPGVPRVATRGWSAFLPVVVDLEREDKINTNMSVVTAVLSAIAWIEEFPEGTTREKAETSMTDALGNFSKALAANRRSNGDARNVQNLRAGSVPKVSAGRKYNAPPMGQRGSDVFIEAKQAILRRIETRWLMPEYMITADASNANYSSTLISGTPFIKAREAEQKTYRSDFREVMFKGLKLALEAGRFRRFVRDWKSFRAMIDLVITPPPVATEDKEKLLQQLTETFDRGVIDANEMRVALRMEPKDDLEEVTGTNNSRHPAPMLPVGLNGQPAVPGGLQLESVAARALQRIAER